MFLKTLCDTLSSNTCLSGLNFKILDTTALDKDLGTCFSAWTWRVICARLSKYLLSRNVRLLRFSWEHSAGIWHHITGRVPLNCQELFTEWYDVMAQKHGVLREKRISSKVAEKNSKYPFPKLHFQDNQSWARLACLCIELWRVLWRSSITYWCQTYCQCSCEQNLCVVCCQFWLNWVK